MKPLGGKSYGSIPHLPNSRLGPGDHSISPGQARICEVQARKGDTIIIQEKLDGSNVCVANIDGEIEALVRSGYRATSSPHGQHHMFAYWVREHEAWFRELIEPGERVCGEWLAQVHGVEYELWHEPFVPFDIIGPEGRLVYNDFCRRLNRLYDRDKTILISPFTYEDNDDGPALAEDAFKWLNEVNFHKAKGDIEGVVYRVEREGRVDFLAKWVRPNKIDGEHMHSDKWNWRAYR